MNHRRSKLIPNPDYVNAPYELTFRFHGKLFSHIRSHRFARSPTPNEWRDPELFALFVAKNSIPSHTLRK
jgi:hypothetical protein